MTKLSKYLSSVLRHSPDEIGISLDRAGWTNIDKLIRAMELAGMKISHAEIAEIATKGTDKRRFQIQGNRIRATHGHSVPVDLGEPTIPPDVLFHASPARNLDGIFKDGLQPGRRQFVHLAGSPEAALSVAARHGANCILLEISAGEMHIAGVEFFKGLDDVWLVPSVPPEKLKVTAV